MESLPVTVIDLRLAGESLSPAVGGGASVFDVANFNALNQQTIDPLAQKTSSINSSPTPPAALEAGGFQSALKVLTTLNGGAQTLGVEALQISAGHKELTPGEMLSITMKAHTFLFQSELTANVANRTSEGVQQLFRQQS